MRGRASLIACVVFALGAFPVLSQQTVGLFVNEAPDPGLTLVIPRVSLTSYLVSNDGLQVNSWTTGKKILNLSHLRWGWFG